MLVNSSYNIFVDDTTNNVYDVTYVFIPPAPPFIAAASALDSNECFGDCNASVQIQILVVMLQFFMMQEQVVH